MRAMIPVEVNCLSCLMHWGRARGGAEAPDAKDAHNHHIKQQTNWRSSAQC